MSNISTLVPDIYNLFKQPHEISEDNVEILVQGLKHSLRESFKQSMSQRENKLRFSNYGLPSRKLWFDIYRHRERQEATRNNNPETQLKFLIGNVMEELLLFLVKEAGHEVEEEQKLLEVDGVRGKKDCRIDGVTTDVKTASKYGFDKFSSGAILLDDKEVDAFGYKYQLGAYMDAEGDKEGAFLVFNKETGEICVVQADSMDMPNVQQKIEQERINLAKDTPPVEKCYEDQPQRKKNDNGNRILHKLCSFCDHKFECWKDSNEGKGLQEYKYSHGSLFFTYLEKEPRVEQIVN